MVKLSIITINYNNAAGLNKTLNSVVSQKNIEFEYLVIDGGSSDGSLAMIKTNESQINYWVSEPDKGIYDAMNKGIVKATGEYCLFLNSGDYLVDDTILSKVFSGHAEADILYGEILFDFGNKGKKMQERPSRLSTFHLFHDNIWHPASFIRRSLFTSIGLYNSSFKIAADYDFFLHAIGIKKVSTCYLPYVISVYDTTGLSTKPENTIQVAFERKEIHKKYFQTEEIEYYENLRKYKFSFLAKWLVNKPVLSSFFNRMLSLYSKIR